VAAPGGGGDRLRNLKISVIRRWAAGPRNPASSAYPSTSTLAALGGQTFSYDANNQLGSDSHDLNGNSEPLIRRLPAHYRAACAASGRKGITFSASAIAR
jgi:hypothetical protein